MTGAWHEVIAALILYAVFTAYFIGGLAVVQYCRKSWIKQSAYYDFCCFLFVLFFVPQCVYLVIKGSGMPYRDSWLWDYYS